VCHLEWSTYLFLLPKWIQAWVVTHSDWAVSESRNTLSLRPTGMWSVRPASWVTKVNSSISYSRERIGCNNTRINNRPTRCCDACSQPDTRCCDTCSQPASQTHAVVTPAASQPASQSARHTLLWRLQPARHTLLWRLQPARHTLLSFLEHILVVFQAIISITQVEVRSVERRTWRKWTLLYSWMRWQVSDS
jgi:hypothetical protein